MIRNKTPANQPTNQLIYIVIHRQNDSSLFSYGYFYWQYTRETLVSFEVISSGCNALVVPFQQPLEGVMEVLLCERVNVIILRHSLISVASQDQNLADCNVNLRFYHSATRKPAQAKEI